MIHHQRQISIEASPEELFDLIETMPDKFPVYGFMETRPMLALRMLLVDGLGAARKMLKDPKPDATVLAVGDPLGPFELTQVQRPYRYAFTLQSFFFNCQTGYTIVGNPATSTLSFFIVADRPTIWEKMYWFFVRPIHAVLAGKVLRAIKSRVERRRKAAMAELTL